VIVDGFTTVKMNSWLRNKVVWGFKLSRSGYNPCNLWPNPRMNPRENIRERMRTIKLEKT